MKINAILISCFCCLCDAMVFMHLVQFKNCVNNFHQCFFLKFPWRFRNPLVEFVNPFDGQFFFFDVFVRIFDVFIIKHCLLSHLFLRFFLPNNKNWFKKIVTIENNQSCLPLNMFHLHKFFFFVIFDHFHQSAFKIVLYLFFI